MEEWKSCGFMKVEEESVLGKEYGKSRRAIKFWEKDNCEECFKEESGRVQAE